MNRITDRISRAAGVTDLVDILAERLAPTDLQSLLLEVFRRRARKLTAPEVLRRYDSSRLGQPAPLEPRLLVSFDQLAFAVAAPPFEPVELSPVAPLGAVSALSGLDQNLAVATVRNSEVVSDSTNLMALECARRRRAHEARRRDAPPIRLCASHRLLRGQAFDDPNLRSHFRLFGLCTAGRDRGAWAFEGEALREQIAVYLRLFARLHEIGLASAPGRVAVTPVSGGPPADVVEPSVFAPLRQHFPGTAFGLDRGRLDGRSYYDGLCFALYVTTRDGDERALVDGGFTGWTQLLLADRKERLLISGVGSEAVCALLSPERRRTRPGVEGVEG